MREHDGKLWSTLHDGKYEVRSLAKADVEDALDVLNKSFFVHEPVCNACEINLPENEQSRLELRELCRLSAQDGVSLMVRHVESGRIVAVSFNKIMFAPPPGEEDFFAKFRKEQVQSHQGQCAMDFMIAVESKVDVCELYNLDCVCELLFLSTLPEFGGLGLGRALTDITIQLTRELGQGQTFEDLAADVRDKRPLAITSLFTSHFTQKIGKAIGFEEVSKVPYTELKYNGQPFNERMAPIHEFCQHAIYKLK